MSVARRSFVPSATQWTTVRCPLTVEINYQVSQGVVLMQPGIGGAGDGGVQWDGQFDYEPIVPGPGSIRRRCDAVRFKSQDAATLAVVSFVALTGADLGETG